MTRTNNPAHAREDTYPRKLEIGVLYGFRALMVLAVVNYHIWQQSWLSQRVSLLGLSTDFDFFTRSSYLFVDGMILLSGFLLYLPYARQTLEGTPVPKTGRFYLNRLLRIVPSYLAAVLLALVCFALPQGAYVTSGAMAKDVAAHLTFTFLFWPETYLYTPLNAALWTIAVEMQFYLLFPFLARAAQKKPAITLPVMAVLGWGWRLGVAHFAQDTGMLINQMPAYLDVYALGMLGAMAYLRMRRAWEHMRPARPRALHLSQMEMRLPLTLVLLGAMLCAAHMPRVLQKVLDNRLMRFLSAISMNLYIWHQILSVQMRVAWFPDANTLHITPVQQRAYSLLCFSVAILVAMAATYGLEQPAARAVNAWIKRLGRKRNHEGPQIGNPCPPADSLFVRPQAGRARADREFRRRAGGSDGTDS